MNYKLLRVTQLDAIQLDNEILKILKSYSENATKYLAPGFIVPFEPEINLFIRVCILKYSILKTGATFGQKLLLVKYDNLTYCKQIFYVIFSCLGYVKERCELSPRIKYNNIVNKIELLLKISAFINLCIFLRNGEKPRLVDRVLGLTQSYEKNFSPRKHGNKYLTRELLWNGFIEFLVFALPLINYHKLRRIFRKTISFQKKTVNEPAAFRIYNIYTRCPHCHESPILPHHMGCSHIFCYICLKSNQLADPKYECPACGYTDIICEPVAAL